MLFVCELFNLHLPALKLARESLSLRPSSLPSSLPLTESTSPCPVSSEEKRFLLRRWSSTDRKTKIPWRAFNSREAIPLLRPLTLLNRSFSDSLWAPNRNQVDGCHAFSTDYSTVAGTEAFSSVGNLLGENGTVVSRRRQFRSWAFGLWRCLLLGWPPRVAVWASVLTPPVYCSGLGSLLITVSPA